MLNYFGLDLADPSGDIDEYDEQEQPINYFHEDSETGETGDESTENNLKEDEHNTEENQHNEQNESENGKLTKVYYFLNS